jgi:hypothetical protein
MRASKAERAALIVFWQRRADGECTTGKALEHVRDDLACWGAPSQLLAMADQAVTDERSHTLWCLQMSERVGGQHRAQACVLGERPLSFSGASDSENRLLRIVFSGCLSETIALHVLRQSQQDITCSALRQVNRQHMAEEVGHGQLGWAFLAWLRQAGIWDADKRRLLTRALPMLYELAENSWLGGAREG